MKMKTCTKCDQTKSISQFYVHRYKRKVKSGEIKQYQTYHSECKLCFGERSKKWVEKNQKKVRHYQEKWRKNNKEKIQQWGKDYLKKNKLEWIQWLKTKIDLKCQECGYNKCFASLDFHHIYPSTKDFNFMGIWKKKPTEKRKKIIAKELKKCITLCANCHRPKHVYYDPLLEENK